MYSLKSYRLEKEEYDYLLPVLKSKLSVRGDKYYFIGSSDDLYDMLSRLKGLYNDFSDVLNSTLVYKCFMEVSIKIFRNGIK